MKTFFEHLESLSSTPPQCGSFRISAHCAARTVNSGCINLAYSFLPESLWSYKIRYNVRSVT